MNERSIRNVLKEIEKTVNANWVIGKKDPFRVLVTTVLSQRTRDGKHTESFGEAFFEV